MIATRRGTSRRLAVLATAIACVAVASAGAGEEAPAAPPPAAARDTLRLRVALLDALDRGIAEKTAQAYLDARRMLDEVLPVPYLGIDAEAGRSGMVVTKVFPLTGAEEAGLLSGDVVLSVAGTATPSAVALGQEIRRRAVGDVLSVEIDRGGKKSTLSVRLGKRPEEDEDPEEQFPGVVVRPTPSTVPYRAAFDVGSTPDLDFLLGGHGAPGEWRVTPSPEGGFLRQSKADPTGIRFPLAIVKGFHSPDVSARVRFRLTDGAQDRAAGIVLRYEDRSNYLVARVNATEGDLRIFRVVHGLRRTLPGARVAAKVGDKEWHVLEFRADGPRLTSRVDGGAEAESYDTFLRGGGVGLWTKSDSVSDFDDLEAAPLGTPSEGPK